MNSDNKLGPMQLSTRTFALVRMEDETGVSGVGVVAQGVMFHDGSVALHWVPTPSSTAVYNSIEDVKRIHGHNGKTKVVYTTWGSHDVAELMKLAEELSEAPW